MIGNLKDVDVGRESVPENNLLERIAQFLDPVRLSTGVTTDELGRRGPQEFPQLNPAGDRPDLPIHALGAQLIAERLGILPALALGAANEFKSGVSEVAQGRPFISPQGVSPRDLEANLQGIERAVGIKLPNIRLPREELIPGFQNGGFIGNVIDNLTNVRADTGALDATAGRLASFNPFAGGLGSTAQNALSNLLATGNPTDVSPLAQAAQSEGARTFQNLAGNINEQFGALNLGSSSARTSALANAAGDVSSRIGEAGLRAGVGAQENAAQRQLGAFNPFAQANQQQIGALGTAGGLQGQSAGLDLNAQTAPLGAQVGLAGNLFGGLQGQVNRPPQALSQGPTFNPGGGGIFAAPQRFQRGGSVPSSGQVRQGAGDRVDFGDFLGELLFNQQFDRQGQQAFAPPPSRGGIFAAPQRAVVQQPQQVNVQPQRRAVPTQGVPQSPQLLGEAFAALGRPNFGAATGGGTNQDNFLRGLSLSFLGPNNVGAGMRTAGQGFSQLLAGQNSTAPAIAQLNQVAQQREKGGPVKSVGKGKSEGVRKGASVAKKAKKIKATGSKTTGVGDSGVIPGQTLPADQEIIAAQGGEGVISVQVMDQLRQAQSDQELLSVAQAIKNMMGFQDGGQVGGGTSQSFVDLLNLLSLTGPRGSQLAQNPQEVIQPFQQSVASQQNQQQINQGQQQIDQNALAQAEQFEIQRQQLEAQNERLRQADERQATLDSIRIQDANRRNSGRGPDRRTEIIQRAGDLIGRSRTSEFGEPTQITAEDARAIAQQQLELEGFGQQGSSAPPRAAQIAQSVADQARAATSPEALAAVQFITEITPQDIAEVPPRDLEQIIAQQLRAAGMTLGDLRRINPDMAKFLGLKDPIDTGRGTKARKELKKRARS